MIIPSNTYVAGDKCQKSLRLRYSRIISTNLSDKFFIPNELISNLSKGFSATYRDSRSRLEPLDALCSYLPLTLLRVLACQLEARTGENPCEYRRADTCDFFEFSDHFRSGKEG